jgi:hypothetical protein
VQPSLSFRPFAGRRARSKVGRVFFSPFFSQTREEGESDEIVIGTYAMCDADTALAALNSAVAAYAHGGGGLCVVGTEIV